MTVRVVPGRGHAKTKCLCAPYAVMSNMHHVGDVDTLMDTKIYIFIYSGGCLSRAVFTPDLGRMRERERERSRYIERKRERERFCVAEREVTAVINST